MASLPDVPNQIHVLDPWIHTISRLIYRFRGGKLRTNKVLVYRVKMYASSLVFLRYLNNLMIFAIVRAIYKALNLNCKVEDKKNPGVL